jgi:hypothetical protein
MAPGFILPPPVFSRRGQPVRGIMGSRMNVVMPKRRAEVVAERSKRLAREAIEGPGSPAGEAGSSAVGVDSMPVEGDYEVESPTGEGDARCEGEIDPESPVDGTGSLSEDEEERESPDSFEGTIQTYDHHHYHDHFPEQDRDTLQPIEQDQERAPMVPISNSIPLLEAPAEIIEYDRPASPDSPLEVGGGVDEFEFDTQPLDDIDENEDEDGLEDDENTTRVESKTTSPATLSPPLPFADRAMVDHLPPIIDTPDQLITESPRLNPSPPILAPIPIQSKPIIPDRIDLPTPPPALGARDLNVKIDTPAPTPVPGLKKQKSLKQLLSFGLSSPPPVPPLPPHLEGPSKKRMTLLSRQSKPNLRVEVKSPKININGPTSAPLPDLKGKGKATDIEKPRMVKRFSLSNMSSAFKKMAGGGGSPIPKVPELPIMYRRKSDQDQDAGEGSSSGTQEEKPRRRSDDISFRGVGSPITNTRFSGLDTPPPIGSPIVFELSPPILPTAVAGPSTFNRGVTRNAVPISPTTPSTSSRDAIAAPASPPSALSNSPPSAVAIAPAPGGLELQSRLARSTSFSSVSSVATSAHGPDTEPHEQQTLIAISPRTQRDPSASLQDYLTRVQSTEVTITQRTHVRQHSLEATIVLSSPPPPLPRHRLMEREDSLGSLTSNRSSGESQNERLKTPLVMPVASMSLDEIRRHIPIVPPRTVMEEGIESSDSFQSLPSLGSGMVVVNSPTSTVTSTSTGQSGTSKSTPKARALVRMMRRQSKGKGKKEEMTMTKTPPPVPVPSNSAQFDSIKQSIKLESLHFEALNIDFSNLDWDSELGNGGGVR